MFKRKLKKELIIGISILASIFVYLLGVFFFNPKQEDNQVVEVKNMKQEEIVTKLDELQATINKDIVGYLTFEQNENPKTQMLPVLLTEGDYYMTHDLYGNKDGCGAVFIDKTEISKESNNTIVYGHSSIKKDCNFTFFKNYKDQKYFKDNEYFTYTNENNEEEKYQVLFMSMINLDSSDGVYLDWYNSYFHNIEDLIEVLNQTSQYAVSDKRIFTLNENDKIMTFVTCDMSQKNARYVLIAKKIS